MNLVEMDIAEAERILKSMSDAEKQVLSKKLAEDQPKLIPQPGPQTAAIESDADVLLYGGAAGGGKTFLDIILALQHHHRTMFMRKEAAQLVAVKNEFEGILGTTDGFNSQSGVWRIPNANGQQVRFGGLNNPGDETKYQGDPKDLLIIDEAANVPEHQALFVMGWVRSTRPGQRCRTVMSSNPPTDSTGLWLIRYFSPWLSPGHPNPAKPGELRWFVATPDGDLEVESDQPCIIVEGQPVYFFDPDDYGPEEIVTPQSRTFIPARITDNAYLRNTPYLSTLQALREPLRSQMLLGDFTASVEDDSRQLIPTEWVRAAQARWTERLSKEPMDSMGVDPARGGRDNTVIARRHGTWYDKLLKYSGGTTPDGPSVAGLVITSRRDGAPIHVDVIGIGASVVDFLRVNQQQTIPINGAEGSEKTDKTGLLKMRNKRAELYWSFYEALDPARDFAICLPPGDGLLEELTAQRFFVTQQGIQLTDKDAVKKIIGRSPDESDAVVYAWEHTDKATTDAFNAPRRRPKLSIA